MFSFASKRLFKALTALTVFIGGVCAAQPSDFEITGHTKFRLTSTTFPEDSLFRALMGSSAEDLGFDCADKGGAGQYYIEIGARATVDSLPGVSGGTSWIS